MFPGVWTWLDAVKVKGELVVVEGAIEDAAGTEGFVKKFGTDEEGGAVVVVTLMVGCVSFVKDGMEEAVVGAEPEMGCEVAQGVEKPEVAPVALRAGFDSGAGEGVGRDEVALTSVGATWLSAFASAGVGGAGVRMIDGTNRVLVLDSEVAALLGSPLVCAASACPLFCSCILARILAIASASRSCFSHLENERKLDRVGLSAGPASIGDAEDVTRRVRLGCDGN